jgi:hypothetical protein
MLISDLRSNIYSFISEDLKRTLSRILKSTGYLKTRIRLIIIFHSMLLKLKFLPFLEKIKNCLFFKLLYLAHYQIYFLSFLMNPFRGRRILFMKHFKFFCLVLLLSLSFIRSTEPNRYQPELIDSCTLDTVSADEIPYFLSSDFSLSKNLEIHFIVKNKIKHRATTSDSTILKTPFFSKLLHFKILVNKLIYSVTTFYQIQCHSHLHLYQLF